MAAPQSFFHAPARARRQAVSVCLLLTLCGAAAIANAHEWAAAWATAPLDFRHTTLQPNGQLAVPERQLQNETVRQRVVLATGGEQVRVRFSNLYGAAPLELGAASVARSTGGDAISPQSATVLTFQGRASTQIAPGQQVWSDPVRMRVPAGQALAVSVYVPGPTALSTGHPGVPPASWSLPGQQVAVAKPATSTALPWNPIVTGIDLGAPPSAKVVVAFGDSITDGAGVSDNAVHSYPALLATRRLKAGPTAPITVVNVGISGNRLLKDGNGPSGLSRFERDVLDQSGITHVLVLIGINDLGYGTMLGERSPLMPDQQLASADEVVAGLQQIVKRSRARGVKVLLGTLLPFKGSPYWSEANELKRQSVNRWIRGRQDVDAVIDFDVALRSRTDALVLATAFDSGDHLHPNRSGLAAMAAAADVPELAE